MGYKGFANTFLQNATVTYFEFLCIAEILICNFFQPLYDEESSNEDVSFSLEAIQKEVEQLKLNSKALLTFF